MWTRRGTRSRYVYNPLKLVYTMEMSKEELIKKYRLHFFVGLIFFITVLSVSLSWHFRKLARENLYASQAIFFDPRSRELTLTDPGLSTKLIGHLGLDMPSWQLPLHCPVVMGDNPHWKECEWKNNAILRIVHFGSDSVECYSISWESSHAKHVPYDCFEIESGNWYGPSNQSKSFMPIQGSFVYQPINYKLGNNGLFNNVVDFYWLSSNGAAVRVHPEDPIQITWNKDGDNQLCIISNYTGPLYYQKNEGHFPQMNYTICNGLDPVKTHTYMQNLFAPGPPEHLPAISDIQTPYWSLHKISPAPSQKVMQEDVLDLVSKLKEHEFPGSRIPLDRHWQAAHGDLEMDVASFPNVTELTNVLQDNGCQLALTVTPYFQYTSKHFHAGVINSTFVKDAGGQVTGLTHFEGGVAAVLDAFHPEGEDWFKSKLQTLLQIPGMSSLRLTYGKHSWLPYKPHFHSVSGTPNTFRKLMTEYVQSVSGSLIVDHTSDSRHVTTLVPVTSDIKKIGGQECIVGTVEKALTLGLMGYPFIMADGLSMSTEGSVGEGTANVKPNRDVYIRWLELSSLMLSRQFNIAPWLYDPEVVALARNTSLLHEMFVVEELDNLKLLEEVRNGLPLFRPVWWLDPSNRSVHSMNIKDEFLVGDNVLVAPVLCSGVTQRDIYVPPGVWEDVHHRNFILGPKTLRNYTIELHRIPLFRRRQLVGDHTKSDL